MLSYTKNTSKVGPYLPLGWHACSEGHERGGEMQTILLYSQFHRLRLEGLTPNGANRGCVLSRCRSHLLYLLDQHASPHSRNQGMFFLTCCTKGSVAIPASQRYTLCYRALVCVQCVFRLVKTTFLNSTNCVELEIICRPLRTRPNACCRAFIGGIECFRCCFPACTENMSERWKHAHTQPR